MIYLAVMIGGGLGSLLRFLISSFGFLPFATVFINIIGSLILGFLTFFFLDRPEIPPGLRFGYGMTSNEAFLKDLLLYQNPWSLNSIAAYAGERMFSDTDYYAKTRELICSERTYMFDELEKNPNFKPYKSY